MWLLTLKVQGKGPESPPPYLTNDKIYKNKVNCINNICYFPIWSNVPGSSKYYENKFNDTPGPINKLNTIFAHPTVGRN